MPLDIARALTFDNVLQLFLLSRRLRRYSNRQLAYRNFTASINENDRAQYLESEERHGESEREIGKFVINSFFFVFVFGFSFYLDSSWLFNIQGDIYYNHVGESQSWGIA